MRANMIYLYEHHAGFDDTTVGFPSISGCHAILLQADNGLYGYHSLGGVSADSAKRRAVGFAQFFRNHAIGATPQVLWGACFLHSRGYGSAGKQGWKAEISEYATAVGLGANDVRGFDIGSGIPEIKVNGTTQTLSAYVEFRLTKGKITIDYKRWSKMKDSSTAALTPGAGDYFKIHPTKGTLDNPDKAMKPCEIIVTKSNKGQIHDASSRGMFTA